MNALNGLAMITFIATNPTALAVIQLIETWADLSVQERRDMISAMNAVVKMQGLPADLVVVTPAALRLNFLKRSAAAGGVSETRMKNIRSLLRRILARIGIVDATNVPPSEAWEDRLSGLTTHDRAGMIGLARYCSARQVGPDDPTDQTLVDYRTWLTDRTLSVNPAKVAGTTRRCWNRLAGRQLGWPAHCLAVADDTHEYILPESAFTQSFRDSVERWGTYATASPLDDLLDDADHEPDAFGGTHARIRKPVRQITADLQKSYLRWTGSALVATGFPIETLMAVIDFVRPLNNARAILKFIAQPSGARVSSAGGVTSPNAAGDGKPQKVIRSAAGTHIGNVLLMIARHEAHLPEQEIEKLRSWVKMVRLEYRGLTEKNKRTVDAVMQPKQEEALLALTKAYLDVAATLYPTAPEQAASLAMRAVAIAILTRIPIRLSNLIGLRLDTHLQHSDPAKPTITHIQIPASNTKNVREITARMPPALDAILQLWINIYRPHVADPGCVFLFPGRGTGNTSITPQGMRDAIIKAMHEHVGVRVTPHQFRHLAARQWLKAFPGDYETLRQMLGHASVQTTIKSYAGEDMEAALERLDDVIMSRKKRYGMRSSSKRGRPPAPRLPSASSRRPSHD